MRWEPRVNWVEITSAFFLVRLAARPFAQNAKKEAEVIRSFYLPNCDRRSVLQSDLNWTDKMGVMALDLRQWSYFDGRRFAKPPVVEFVD